MTGCFWLMTQEGLSQKSRLEQKPERKNKRAKGDENYDYEQGCLAWQSRRRQDKSITTNWRNKTGQIVQLPIHCRFYGSCERSEQLPFEEWHKSATPILRLR